MKILISKEININLFCQNPIINLEKTDNGAIAVCENNIPVFYAVTPIFLKKIFSAEYELNNKKNKKTYHQKFAMYDEWKPDENLVHQAKLWGIILNEPIKLCELAYFISYWKAEKCFFYHIQWQQKLARSIQKSRSLDYIKKNRRDITYIPKPDHKTPSGFRGE